MKRSCLVTRWFFIWVVLLCGTASAGILYDDLIIQSIFVVISLIFLLSLLGSFFLVFNRKRVFKLEPSSSEIALEAGQFRSLTIKLVSTVPLWPWRVEIEPIGANFLWFSTNPQNLSWETSLGIEIFGLRRGYLEQTVNVIVKDPLEIFCIKAGHIFIKAECYPNISVQERLAEVKARVEGDIFPRLGSDSGDPLKLRQYQPGDPLKRIAWKLFAKRSELISRVLEPADDEAKTIILYSYLLPEDEIVAAASLRIAELLSEEGFSLIYSTNLSNDLTSDFGQFKREVLNSSEEVPRKSLDDFLAKLPQVIFNRQVLLVYSEGGQNLEIASVIDRFYMKDQINKIPCPKTVEQRRVLDMFFEPTKKNFQPASNLEFNR